MSKTAPEVQAEIDDLILSLPRAIAGSYSKMLSYIRRNCDGRPGFLWLNAAALPAEQLSSVLGCTPDKVPALLERMLRKSPGMLRRDEAGTLFSPHLARIAKIKGAQKRRADRFRSRHGPNEALRNASEGVTSHRSNAAITPSPPDGFSLSHSLSSFPPVVVVPREDSERESVNRILRETGLAMSFGSQQRPELERLVRQFGESASFESIQMAKASGVGGLSAVRWASKRLTGEARKAAQEQQRPGPPKAAVCRKDR